MNKKNILKRFFKSSKRRKRMLLHGNHVLIPTNAYPHLISQLNIIHIGCNSYYVLNITGEELLELIKKLGAPTEPTKKTSESGATE